MNVEQQFNPWGQIVAKAWQDDKFKRRLLAEPAAVFKELRLDVPPGVEIRVLENTGTILNLTLPAKPLEGELSKDELAGVAGGGPIANGVKSGMFWAMFFAGMMPTKTAQPDKA